MFPYGETVTIVSRAVTGQDGDGNDIYVPVETDVPGAAFAPGGHSELIQGQDMVITNPTIYLPAGAPVPRATDRLRRANGDLYEIDGEPEAYPPSPLTGNTYLSAVVRLKKVTG